MGPPEAIIHSTEGIRSIEREHATVGQPLMERAGAAAANLAQSLLQREGTIVVACGPGNNGGDGLVLARLLKTSGHRVCVLFAGDEDRLPPDAAQAMAAWRSAGGSCVAALPADIERTTSLVVDALFGIGLQRPLENPIAALVERLSRFDCPRLALDLPSGLDAQTGAILGCAFRATHTVSFIAHKAGLLTGDGPDLCGRISIADLDIPPRRLPDSGQLLGPANFSEHLRPRKRNSHKGSFGDVVVLGGARGMVGAAFLAGRAALHIGAGRVFVGLLDSSVPPIDPGQPELMVRSAASLAQAPAALAVGPGLGRGTGAIKALSQALGGKAPLVLDADALNLVAEDPDLAVQLGSRQAEAVLTPHPAEAARLLACTTEAVQADRVAAARELARRYRCAALLKGCGSVIATPRGDWYINTTGNPGMATAGMGDTLSGLIAGLIAQGWPAEQALLCAVHLHGAAADLLAGDDIGPIGMTAGETALAARRIFNRWIVAC